MDELNPPTKLIGKFLKTWGDREKSRAQYSNSSIISSSVDRQDPVGITLTLSSRLIDVFKVKSILHIEAGIEMIALAMAISSEVCNIFDILYCSGSSLN